MTSVFSLSIHFKLWFARQQPLCISSSLILIFLSKIISWIVLVHFEHSSKFLIFIHLFHHSFLHHYNIGFLSQQFLTFLMSLSDRLYSCGDTLHILLHIQCTCKKIKIKINTLWASSRPGSPPVLALPPVLLAKDPHAWPLWAEAQPFTSRARAKRQGPTAGGVQKEPGGFHCRWITTD